MSDVYPRLSQSRARELHSQLAGQSLESFKVSIGEEDRQGYWPQSVGLRASDKTLSGLMETLQECCASVQEMHDPGSQVFGRELDRQLSVLFATDERWTSIRRGELLDLRFWAWVALVGDPQTATLRFSATSEKRFIANLRNVYFRCWQRGTALHDEQNSSDPWHLLGLKEDQMVAIFERPGLAASRVLAVSIARVAIRWTNVASCEDITRDALKRIMAWNVPRSLELLNAAELEKVCSSAFESAYASLGLNQSNELRREAKEATP